MTHFTTTVLDFGDRLEGQILAVGELEDCEAVMSGISAISCDHHGQTPKSARIVVKDVVADAPWQPTVGEYWRYVPATNEFFTLQDKVETREML